MEQNQIRSQIAQTEFEGRVKSRQYMMQGLTGVATGLYKYGVSKA